MDCAYFETDRCRSCANLETPYTRQLATKQQQVADQLVDVIRSDAWRAPAPSPTEGFRNKAKLAVGGTPGDVTLGILDADFMGVDLQGCPAYEPAIVRALPALAEFVNARGLEPYSVADRRGELKYLIVTANPAGRLMVRFVGRTDRTFHAVRKNLDTVMGAIPANVVTVNLHPEHRAVLHGDVEHVVSEDHLFSMDLPTVRLYLQARSFFQTNTTVCARLYDAAASWLAAQEPRTVWDLYCGVGGFALHLASRVPPHTRVVGVEVVPEAIHAARRAADELHPDVARPDFVAGDATDASRLTADPDAVIVNPPRRGLGDDAARWLASSSASAVLYSSCNPATLARDLRAFSGFAVESAQLFDMFPHTSHAEVLVMLRRDRA